MLFRRPTYSYQLSASLAQRDEKYTSFLITQCNSRKVVAFSNNVVPKTSVDVLPEDIREILVAANKS